MTDVLSQSLFFFNFCLLNLINEVLLTEKFNFWKSWQGGDTGVML